MNEQESRLVELVLKGNSEAFEPLVRPYRKILLSLAFRLSLDWEEAKEISQDTLLRAFRYLRTYDKKRTFKNWLLQIQVNVWRNQRRKNSGSEPLAEFRAANQSEAPDERYHRREIRSQLLECLDGLTPREKEVFLLRDLEDQNIKETARILGTSSLSVRVHLSSARKKIKDRIREKFPHLLERRP